MFVASTDQLHNLRMHHRPADDGHGAVDIDERGYAELGVNVTGRAKPSVDGNDGAAVESGLGYLMLLAKNGAGVQLARSNQSAAVGAKLGQKRTAIPGKLQIHGQFLPAF